jgi:vitamin B12 transporter
MKGILIKNKYIIFILAAIVVASLPAGPARAAAEKPDVDEQALMALFYEEDDLVEAATGAPKPISQVAENVTIITQEEIDALHAHNLGDVLKYVSGLHLSSSNEPFGDSLPFIHGSDYEHVLVLIDGIRWGYVFADYPNMRSIPVRIVKRIEVLKGPASSTWGSALGGVINIITKDTGTTDRPEGEVFATYGEHSTYEAAAEIQGRLSKLGYYLHAGRNHSDGITLNRAAAGNSFYGKMDLAPNNNWRFSFTSGYTEPEFVYVKRYDKDYDYQNSDRTQFYTASLDATLSDTITAFLSLYHYKHKFTDSARTLSTGLAQDAYVYNSKTNGVSGRLVWSPVNHTVVLGAEAQRAEVTATIDFFDFDISLGPVDNEEQNWAVFLNDTYRWGKLSLTPGVRYDNLELADNQVSPSIGLTYNLFSHTLLRGVLARGFRKPVIGLTQYNVFDEMYMMFSGDRVSNPNLEAEEVDSFQLGFETSAMGWCWFKGTFFIHQADKVWFSDPATDIWYNNGKSENRGGEAEIRTLPWHNLSLRANATYVRVDPDTEPSDIHWLANVMLRYADPQVFTAQLLGHYVDYGHYADPNASSSDDMIWDLHLAKMIPFNDMQSIEFFGICHNLFEGNQTWNNNLPVAARWFEVGARLLF